MCYTEGSPFTFEARGEFPWPWLDLDMPCVYGLSGSQTDEYSLVTSLIRKLAIAAKQLRHVQFVINTGSLSQVVDHPVPETILFTLNAPQMRVRSE